MRLIDADEFMRIVLRCEKLNRECPLSEEKKKDKDINNYETGQRETFELIIEHLEKQPTAYKVDKVVEQLEKEKEQLYCGLISRGGRANGKSIVYGGNMAYKKAIEIVKAGGVNE